MKKVWLVVFGVVSCLLMMAAPASASDMVVTPSSVAPGGSVAISGSVQGGCPAPSTLILVSDIPLFNGTDFVGVPVDATAHFSVRVHVNSSITPGTHGVLARCVGPNDPLGPSAGAEIGGPFPTFTVIGLAFTGGSIGPLSDAAATAIAFTLLTIGLAAILFGTGWRHRSIERSARG